MGLASSQARLLLLTARKSDLEYRSQMISQRKLTLAMQTEEIATEYTQKMSNRKLMFSFDQDANAGTQLSVNLSYAQLVGENSALVGKYIVVDPSGKLVVPNAESLPSGFQYSKQGDKEYATYVDKDGNVTAQYEINVCQEVSNSYIFQNALRNGGLYLQKLNDDGEFETSPWQNNPNIIDKYDTSDDDVAQSEYEAKSLKIQNQDKMLDLELKQIETQHKAVETEYDSVKKIIDKNIEVSYKIFSNG